MEILHGENILQSRQELQKGLALAQAKEQEIIWLNGKKAQLLDFKQALETLSLWPNGRLVIIENFFNQPQSKAKKEILNYLKQIAPETNLVLWENKKIDGRKLRGFEKTKTTYFKITPVIFKFLDSLRPGNSRQMLAFLCQSQQTEPAEMLFYMLCRQIRTLILAKDLGKRGLSGMPFWMANKFLHQAQFFSLEKLLFVHQKLLQIDYEQKTGRAVMSLDFYLDLLIASL